MIIRQQLRIALLNLVLLFALGIGTLSAQGWETKFIYPAGNQKLDYITQAPNGDYIGTASGQYFNLVTVGNYVIRYDVNGDTLFSHWLPPTLANSSPFPQGISATADGGAVIAGYRNTASDSANYLLRIAANGSAMWTRDIVSPDDRLIRDVVVAPNGDIVTCGDARPTGGGGAGWDMWVTRYDSLGNILWEVILSRAGYDAAKKVRIANDGNIMVFGTEDSFSSAKNKLYKLNVANGNVLWQKVHPYMGTTQPASFATTSDGGFLLSGIFWGAVTNNVSRLYVIKCDSGGDTLWTKNYLTRELTRSYTLHENNCGQVALLSQEQYTWPVVMLLDSIGNEIWSQQLSIDKYLTDLIVTPDSGIVIAGSWGPDTLNSGPYLARMNKNGDIFSNQITGTLYEDANGNCLYDSGELTFPNALIQVTNQATSLPEFTTTDNLGNYDITVPVGTHEVLAWPVGTYWTQTCPANPLTQTVTFTQPYDTINQVDFGFEPSILCPELSVNIGTPIMRRCSSSTFAVNYCNTGTVPATGATIEIVLDSLYTLNTATIPWITPQVGNTYVFNVGNIPVNGCANFSFTATLSCNAYIGQTHCFEAHIYPDSICLPVDPSWDGSVIEVEAECGNDTSWFTIRNTSANDMTLPGGYVILEDNILRVSNGTFQLTAGDSLMVPIVSNGSTWIMQVEQSPGHPGLSMPIAFLEGCGTNGSGGVSQGFVTPYPMDDLDPFVDVFCLENTAAYDPNDKRVFPSGIGLDNNVFQEEQFEYMIRFQNTGNDTAFTVVIRDTLTPDIDISTLRSGVSSHPYSFRIYGNRIAEWTFNQILLPDSNINEPGSHGFVMFTTDREGNLPIGHRINNNAHIYFDYNAPVETGIAFVTLGEDVWLMISVDPPVTSDLKEIKVFPNPMTETAIFDLGEQYPEFDLDIIDLSGRVAFSNRYTQTDQARLSRGNLPAGMYIFRIRSGGEVLGTGRLVVY